MLVAPFPNSQLRPARGRARPARDIDFVRQLLKSFKTLSRDPQPLTYAQSQWRIEQIHKWFIIAKGCTGSFRFSPSCSLHAHFDFDGIEKG